MNRHRILVSAALVLAVLLAAAPATVFAAEGPPTRSAPAESGDKQGADDSGIGQDGDVGSTDKSFLEKAKDVGQAIVDTAKDVGQAIVDTAKDVGTAIADAAKTAWDEIKTWPDQRWFQIAVVAVVAVGLVVGSLFAGPVLAGILVGAAFGLAGSLLTQLSAPPEDFSWTRLASEGAIGGLAGGLGAYAGAVLKAAWAGGATRFIGTAGGKWVGRAAGNFLGAWMGGEFQAIAMYWDQPEKLQQAQLGVLISCFLAVGMGQLQTEWKFLRVKTPIVNKITQSKFGSWLSGRSNLPLGDSLTVRQVHTAAMQASSSGAAETVRSVVDSGTDLVVDKVADAAGDVITKGAEDALFGAAE